VEQDRPHNVQLLLDELARSPPRPHRTIVELISNTTATKGLKIGAEEDFNYYETVTKIITSELAAVPLTRHKLHGDWYYMKSAIRQSVNPKFQYRKRLSSALQNYELDLGERSSLEPQDDVNHSCKARKAE
jgi:Rhodopirellula transposase DDE domain